MAKQEFVWNREFLTKNDLLSGGGGAEYLLVDFPFLELFGALGACRFGWLGISVGFLLQKVVSSQIVWRFFNSFLKSIQCC